ncbi:MAG: PKD domain-containing protein [Methanomassiliicoccales archaeon]|nr:MAG: PKD domain-containing protein [Methanomassiliicoccales archaeon]
MIPKAWARVLSLAIVCSLLTGLYVITDFPVMEVKAVNHGGVVTQNETWKGAQNHIIQMNVTIPEGIVVEIEAGADVQFEGGPLNIFVNGTLIINGTSEDPVTFWPRVQAGKEMPGDWGSVYYNATANDTVSKVSYAIMGYGTEALYLEDTNILVENVHIHNMSQSGIVSYASSPIIRNSTIHYNNFGIWMEAGGEPLIENNTIEWNWYDGIYGVSRVKPTIINNRVWKNIDDGIHLLALFSQGLVANNTVIENRDMGIVLNVRADVLVKDNNISLNWDAGIWIRTASPIIQHNLVTNNTRNGIRIFDCKISEFCPAPQIINNTIAYNNKESGLYPGIFVENADPLIANNYIAFNDAEGIYLRRDSGGNISSNAIINNEIGISVNDSSPWILNNNPISGNVAGIYVKKGKPLIRDNVLTNNKYGIYTYDEAQPGIYRNVISSASGKDLIVGDKEGKVTYFENRGESVFMDKGRMKLETGEDIDVGLYADPAWGDLDYDGLDDLLVGNGLGNVHYYRNLGNGYFRDMGRLTNETPVTQIGNLVGMYCHPFVTDWDNDSDLDLFCGNSLGNIFYLSNNGDDVFTNEGMLMDGFLPIDLSMAAPIFERWNPDQDRDLIVGEYWGSVRYYENSKGDGNRSFLFIDNVRMSDNSPIIGPNYTVPSLADWDNISATKDDLTISNDTGVYFYKRATGNTFDPPIKFISSGNPITARAVDWNGDGSMDFITGEIGGYVKYHRNDGLNSFNAFQIKNGTKDLYLPTWASPFPIDFDGDGILDLIIGDQDGDVWFFRGTALGGSPVVEFVSILTASGTRQPLKVGPPGFGMATPVAVDWRNIGRADLIVGEVNGWIWLFTDDGDETYSSEGRAHNETGKPIRTFWLNSAPGVGDWDGDMWLDLIVGDQNGYIHFWRRNIVLGDLFNFTDMGYLMADGSPLKVSSYANPYVDDWNADGDLDILIGEESGRVMYYENDGDGTLSFKGNLTNVLGGDVKVSNNTAPQGVGYYGSIQGYKGGIGIYCKDSSPNIQNNVMIKGGDGNRTVGEGDMGGIGIYLLRSSATIKGNMNITGGTGGLGLTTPTGDVIGGRGGHGIFLDNSTGWIEDNVIIGGLGGPAEDATSPYLSIGGAGGSGVYSVNNTTTTIIDDTIIAGEGNWGINGTGEHGAGVKAMDNSAPYVMNSIISGPIGVYADNSTPFIVNSTITANMSFNATNHAHIIALNTTFDRTNTYYGDDASVLETQWFINIKVVDRSGFSVPQAEVVLERDGFAFQGHLQSGFAPLLTTPGPSPTVVDWDGDGLDDLIVGENDGDVQFYRNRGDGTFQTPPDTLIRGNPLRITRPYVYDLDFDGNPDIVLGDSLGKVYWYKRNGTDLELYDTFKIEDDFGVVIGEVNVSNNMKAAPAVGDWNLDGYWDLWVGDGMGNVNIFIRNKTSFLKFKPGGLARMTDGSPVRAMMDAIPHVVDWNRDGYRDLILSSMGQVRLYLSCENGTMLYGGPFYANKSGLQPIQVGGFSAATVTDMNDDGDLDLIVGATNSSLLNAGNIEYFESNKNGDSRTFQSDDDGVVGWVIATEFIESDKNGNHFGNDPGDKVFYTQHTIKAKKNIDIGCAAPQALMTESRDVYVQMCRDVTLPIVVKTDPKSGEEGVPLNKKVTIWFSKPMNPNRVILTFWTSNYTPQWTDNNMTLILTPDPVLTEDTHYTIEIWGGSEDAIGMKLDGNRNGKWDGPRDDTYFFSFHTERVGPPEPPVAVLTHWPSPNITTFVSGTELLFDGRNSTDDDAIGYWNMTIFNGTDYFYPEGPDIQNATTPPITFTVNGTYCSNLTVWDITGLSDNATDCVTIIGDDVIPPDADAGPDQRVAPFQMVTFDGSNSSDNVTPLTLLNFTWTFNDGGPKIEWGMNPTYATGFSAVADYIVMLAVKDEANNTGFDNMTVHVVDDPVPEADAGPSQDVCAGDVVTLDASSTTDNNPLANLTFNWTFDDGTGPVFLQGMIVTHQFNASGNFPIMLNVTDESGGWDLDATWVNVTVCIPPTVDESGPRGPDKLADTIVWAEFSKDMATPSILSSFSLIIDGTPTQIAGDPVYNSTNYNFTFTPFQPLSYGTTYRACFNADIARDTEGFFLDGNFCWTFKTAELPWVVFIEPGADEPNVHVGANISISFNDPMDPSSVQSAFTVRDGVTVWDNTSFSVSWDVDMLVFTFANSSFGFNFSTTYNVTLDSSVARSRRGVYLDGNMNGTPEGSPVDDYSWFFTTEATPTVTGIPTGSDVPLNADIVMSFSKIMDWPSVKSAITIKEGTDPIQIDSFGNVTWNDAAMTFSINPFILKHGTAYNINISGDSSSGAKDLNGNSLDGNKNDILEGSPTDNYSWEFTTMAQDLDPPHVTDAYPANGTLGVLLDSLITVTFDELMNETSFITGVAVKENATTMTLEPFGTLEWFSANQIIVITPLSDLAYDTKYTIIISGSHFDGVVDLAGNPLDGNWNDVSEGSPADDHWFWFMTADPIPPYVVNTTPPADDTNVSLGTNISATFDDDMDESSIAPENVSVRDEYGNPVSGQVTYNTQRRMLFFDPDENLKPGRNYTVNISNVKDDDGNTILNGYYAWSFQTELDVSPPNVTITFPYDGFTEKRGNMVQITGTAFDNAEIQTLHIRIGDGDWTSIIDNYNPGDGSWSYSWNTAQSALGEIVIEVEAYDPSPLVDRDQISVYLEEKPGEDLTGVILVAIAIILAVLSTIIFLLMWKRRKQPVEEEPMPGEEAEEEEVLEEEEGEEPEEVGWEEPELVEEEEEVVGEEEPDEKPARRIKK